MDHGFLHPDGRNFQPDRLIDDLFHRTQAAENVDDIDPLKGIEAARRTFSPRRAFDFWIHG
jgi:hypothetical protein